MSTALDSLMETASQALSDMQYNRCELLCIDALTQARDQSDWAYYRRIVLPLQEARRLRRQAALDGSIRLGVSTCEGEPSRLLMSNTTGCMVLTHPCSAADAAPVLAEASEWFEVLYADSQIDGSTWTIQSTVDANLKTDMKAPDRGLCDVWISPTNPTQRSAAHWFMRASEALGDAGLASIQSPMGSVDRVIEIEAVLAAAGDHELLHQALAEAARAAQEAGG